MAETISRKRLPLTLLLSLALLPLFAASCAGQGASARMENFQGTWSARYQGRLLARITLTLHGGQLSGTAVLAKHVSFNAQGALTAVSAAHTTGMASQARLDGDSLVVTEKTSDDTEHLWLRRAGKTAIALTIEGVPMQPWVLHRGTARPR